MVSIETSNNINQESKKQPDLSSRPRAANNELQLDFSELKDQTQANKNEPDKEKKSSLEKMHRFIKESDAGKMITGVLPLSGVITGIWGLVNLLSSDKKSEGGIELGIGATLIGIYSAIKLWLLPKAQKIIDQKMQKFLGNKINLEQDLIFDDDTKKKLWIAIKQFFGYRSSLQDSEASFEQSALGGNMMILYGPPGTGKTMIANGIAQQADKKLIYINVSDIESKYLGESEKNLADTFERAEKTGSWLFFDEADALLQARGALKKDHTVKLTNTFIQMYNQYKNRTKIILATNTPDNIDPAIKSRGILLGVKTPPKEVRLQILLQKLRRLRIKEANIKELAEKHSKELLELIDKYKFAGRDIESAVLRAMHAAEGRIHRDKLLNKPASEKLKIEDLQTSFAEIHKEIEDGKKSSIETALGF